MLLSFSKENLTFSQIELLSLVPVFRGSILCLCLPLSYKVRDTEFDEYLLFNSFF